MATPSGFEYLSGYTGTPKEIVAANMIRMFHLGLVEPVAIGTHDDSGRATTYWSATLHARDHMYFVPRCAACRTREIYAAAREAMHT